MAAAGGPKMRLLNIIMQIRKVCNHPYLFDGAEVCFTPHSQISLQLFSDALCCVLSPLLCCKQSPVRLTMRAIT
jgi:SNF2 family DNA or RNA helicase